ncbi:hypothetical protein ACJIZ3_011456 [Penstemon smallii]|uniref:Uncharacterized protein n=1 Tax=Penstemon smallii TaxID=265156 RepID=A0ABD3UJ75_9LAMI
MHPPPFVESDIVVISDKSTLSSSST